MRRITTGILVAGLTFLAAPVLAIDYGQDIPRPVMPGSGSNTDTGSGGGEAQPGAVGSMGQHRARDDGTNRNDSKPSGSDSDTTGSGTTGSGTGDTGRTGGSGTMGGTGSGSGMDMPGSGR